MSHDKPSTVSSNVDRIIAEMPVALLAKHGGPALAYAMEVEQYFRRVLTEYRVGEVSNCGDHFSLGHRPLQVGCGGQIETLDGLYRCAQCGVAFHLECLRQHFGWPEAGGGPMPHGLDRALAEAGAELRGTGGAPE